MNRPSDPIARATEIQRQAADPSCSVALRASAGSGKTKVLIDRFVRLCIEGSKPASPRSILAITFTRKAATEIQDRLLERARKMALATPAQLDGQLRKLLGREPTDGERDGAARLFERLLENPGGMQVGTLHSFCQRILSRFAAEAGLDPRARLIEDRDELFDEALDAVLGAAATDPDPRAPGTLVSASPDGLRKALRAFFGQQMRMERWLRRTAAHHDRPVEPRTALLPELVAEVRAWLFPGENLPDDPDSDHLLPELRERLEEFAGAGLAAVAGSLDADEARRFAKGLQALATDAAAARTAAEANDAETAWRLARKLLLTTGGSVRVFTRVKDEDLKARFQAAVLERAAPLLSTLRRSALLELERRNRALLTLGLDLLDRYAGLKRRDGVVDFGDLEDMACRLMGDRGRALSLLHRLDDTIGHILLDEFQDTNWNQLEILQPFLDEFLARGDDGPRPTVFAVGDLKQSIYGFRGAEPAIFARFDRNLQGPGRLSLNLPTNFRSLSAVVDGVGDVFRAEPLAAALPEGEFEHVAQAVGREDGPGAVFAPPAFADAGDEDGRAARQVAADAAARLVRELVDGGVEVTVEEDGAFVRRPVEWRDILLVMRSRTDAALYEQALRSAGVPIEPAGRGMLAASREVQDVLALLRWLAWPDDDVALATVLRSPLLRLDEAGFQGLLDARDLRRRREGGGWRTPTGLWSTLRRQAGGDPALKPVAERLAAWRAAAGFVDVHDLLRRIVRDGDVAARYRAALGDQAAFNLARLYDVALGADVAATPTLRRFVEVLERAARRGGEDEAQPARGSGGGRVRMMTVHGAKGLEAPVVLMIDADRRLADRDTVVRLNPSDDSTGLIFGATRELRIGFTGAETVLPRDLLQDGCRLARDGAETEEGNLLYVALTRARDRLYVMGAESGADEAEPRSPLARLRAAARAADARTIGLDDPAGWTRPPEPPEPVAADQDVAGDRARVWRAPTLGRRTEPVAPSSLAAGDPPPSPAGGDPSEERIDARGHGDAVHLLLQRACDRQRFPAGDSRAHLEAAAVFAADGLSWVFHPPADVEGISEMPFVLRREDDRGRPEVLTGAMDRVLVGPGGVDVIDYKSNRGAADASHRARLAEHYAPQLAAYGQAAAALWPDREVRTWLLFTAPDVPDGERLVPVASESGNP